MKPVFISAAQFEVEPIVTAIRSHSIHPESKLVGIGALNAAKNARAVADFCRGRHVIFVGTCGSFTTFEDVELVRITRAFWSPTGERLGLAYTIQGTAPPISLPDPPKWAITLPTREVLCSPTISLTSELPDGLVASNFVENIELYSCIGELAASSATLSVILAITNLVGSESHAQWRQNFESAAKKTADFLLEKLT